MWLFLLVRLSFSFLLENILPKWKRQPLPLKDVKCWPILDVYLLCNGSSVKKGYLRGHVTFKPVAKRLEVELPLNLFMQTTYICRDRDSNLNPHHVRRMLCQPSHCAGCIENEINHHILYSGQYHVYTD